MNRFNLLLPLLALSLFLTQSSTAWGQTSLNGNNRTDTVACDGQDVEINGNDSSVILTGNCGSVNVAGNGNVVSIEATANIKVLGNGNKVTWARSTSGDKPGIMALGDGNTVEQGASASPTTESSEGESKAELESNDTVVVVGPSLVLINNGVRKTYNCNGRDVSVNGNKCELVFEGRCGSISVNGNKNTVHVDAAASIAVTGNKNRVTWSAGVDSSSPSVSNLGNKNSIAKKSP